MIFSALANSWHAVTNPSNPAAAMIASSVSLGIAAIRNSVPSTGSGGLLQGTPGGANGAIERIPVQMGTASGSDTPYRGRLQLIDNQVDAASGTIRLRAAFVNGDGSLIPGQFARVRLGQPHATHPPASPRFLIESARFAPP